MFFRMVYKSGQIFLPFCHNTRVWQTDGQTDGQTDRQTDRILITIPRLHYMQRGKNEHCSFTPVNRPRFCSSGILSAGIFGQWVPFHSTPAVYLPVNRPIYRLVGSLLYAVQFTSGIQIARFRSICRDRMSFNCSTNWWNRRTRACADKA